jgi:hypothetical protein
MKIKLIWGERKDARKRLKEAEHEVNISREKYNEWRADTAAPLHTLQEQNHFAEILAESLIKGYSK